MSDRKIVFIVVLVVVLLLVTGAYAFLWTQREGGSVRGSYRGSDYVLSLFGNLSESDIDNIELIIPVPTIEDGIGESDDLAQIEDTAHGTMMDIKIIDTRWRNQYDPPLPPDTHAYWRYKSKLTDQAFSTQENQSIWIYANLTNVNEKVYFTLIKEDSWSTLGLFETQIDYVAVLNNTFAQRYSNYNDREDHVENNALELKDGWNKYPLVSGTYNQYDD